MCSRAFASRFSGQGFRCPNTTRRWAQIKEACGKRRGSGPGTKGDITKAAETATASLYRKAWVFPQNEEATRQSGLIRKTFRRLSAAG